MPNPEEKLKEVLQKMLNGFELLQKLDEANEAEEIQHLKEEMEKSLKAMKNDINDAEALFAKQKEIYETEFYQQTVETFGKEQADELWDGMLRCYRGILL